MATSNKSDCVEGEHQSLQGETISGIVSGLRALVIGSITVHLTDDDVKAIDVQIDKVSHLKELPHSFLSPHQTLQQHRSLNSSFILNSDS